MIPLADVSWRGIPGYGMVAAQVSYDGKCACQICRVARQVLTWWRAP